MSFTARISIKGKGKGKPEDFSIRNQTLAALVAAMQSAQVLDDLPAPELPVWPPKGAGIRAARAEKLRSYFEDGVAIDPAPTAAEARAWREHADRLKTVLATPSPNPKLVPKFKFESQDGWIVSSAEAARISSSLESYLEDEDARSYLPDILGLDDDELQKLLTLIKDWSRFNERASRQQGYIVS